MGRWTQFEEDAYRLPQGMKRIGYDADTMIYTFRDEKGKIYQGPPGSDYGTLTPVSNNARSSRPEAFDSGEPQNELPVSTGNPPSTFHDILPANLITTPSSSVDAQSPRSPRSPKFPDDPMHPRARFIDAVRRTAVPKVQGVVHNLRRSVTTSRGKQPDRQRGRDDAEYRLLPDVSNLSRSASMATTRSSSTQATLVNDSPPRH